MCEEHKKREEKFEKYMKENGGEGEHEVVQGNMATAKERCYRYKKIENGETRGYGCMYQIILNVNHPITNKL